MVNEWADFLNPDVVRTRFVRAGLFLVAHEMLISSIKDRLHDFFSDTWSAEDGWKTTIKYREKVLSLDPKKKNDPLRASVAWLRHIGAIDDADEKAIQKLTNERNLLAHELRKVLGGSHRHDFESLFPQLTALVVKIDKWWVINLEIATDPDVMNSDIDLDGVVAGSQMLLQVLAEVALGQDDKAWELYKEIIEQHGSVKAR